MVFRLFTLPVSLWNHFRSILLDQEMNLKKIIIKKYWFFIFKKVKEASSSVLRAETVHRTRNLRVFNHRPNSITAVKCPDREPPPKDAVRRSVIFLLVGKGKIFSESRQKSRFSVILVRRRGGSYFSCYRMFFP